MSHTLNNRYVFYIHILFISWKQLSSNLLEVEGERNVLKRKLERVFWNAWVTERYKILELEWCT